ncbi:MAG: zinc-dependent peptidase, partial [Chitinophagaceae bacterium]|nr:zinc-dependent peptidase [Chitinophagaceae bacterium]
VLSEYFFEKPEFLNRNHPVLYQKLRTIFERHT